MNKTLLIPTTSIRLCLKIENKASWFLISSSPSDVERSGNTRPLIYPHEKKSQRLRSRKRGCYAVGSLLSIQRVQNVCSTSMKIM